MYQYEKITLILKIKIIIVQLLYQTKSLRNFNRYCLLMCMHLIAEMPELGTLNNKQIAALLGVVPFIRQIGKHKGVAKTGGGR